MSYIGKQKERVKKATPVPLPKRETVPTEPSIPAPEWPVAPPIEKPIEVPNWPVPVELPRQ